MNNNKISSYQKLKLRNAHLQEIVDLFRHSLSVMKTAPETRIENGTFFVENAYLVVENSIDEELQRRLTHWVINNLDENVIKQWLEFKKGEENGNRKRQN